MELLTLDPNNRASKRDVSGKTALHHTAELADAIKIEQLLSVKSDINAKDKNGRTPLHLLAMKNVDESHYEVAEILLKTGVDINMIDHSGKSALYYLTEQGNVKIVHLFLSFKADVTVMNYDRETLLFPVVKHNKNAEVLQLLVKLGLNVNHCSAIQRTPLHAVAMYNVDNSHLELAEILLNSGANPNARDNEGQTPLWFLAKSGNADIFNLFLKFKADLSVQNIRKHSLLFPAVLYNKNPEVVQLLVDHGLDVNLCDDDGKTPLYEAARNPGGDKVKLKMAEVLLKSGADVSTRDYAGLTPVFYWLRSANLETIQLFLNYNARVHGVMNNGCNFLFPAVSHNGNVEVIQLLVDLGLDVNHVCYSGKRTPLHCAAIFNESENVAEITDVLLKKGANCYAQDNEGRTPLWYFVKQGNAKVVELFLNNNVEVDMICNMGGNLLFPAADHNRNADVLKLLLDRGLDVDHRCLMGKTPLLLACDSDSDNIQVIKVLLKNHADMNATDYQGLTPFIYASRLYNGEEVMKKKFKLIMEHTDFSDDVYGHLRIFRGRYENRPDYLTLEHLAKLESLNSPVHQAILDSISNHEKYSNYFDKCKEELHRAKSSKLKDSWVTFYHLLTDNRRKLKNYAGNQGLMQDFQNSDFMEKFPIYGAAMVGNVKKGIERRELFDKASIVLSDCLPIFIPTHLIVKDALDCVLSRKDLSKFCE